MKVLPTPTRPTPPRDIPASRTTSTPATTGSAETTGPRAVAADQIESRRTGHPAGLRAPLAGDVQSEAIARAGDGNIHQRMLQARTRGTPVHGPAKGGQDARPSVGDAVDEALQRFDQATAEGRATPVPHRENYFDDARDVAAIHSERQEQQTLGASQGAGRLVPAAEGEPGAGLRVTIHGINDAPEGVHPLTSQAAGTDARVDSFHYDDQTRRLTDSSRDMAEQLGGWLETHPGEPLTVDAHSMGSRVSIAALAQLQREGRLEGRQVELNMVAPPLAGVERANGAQSAPAVLNGVNGVAPGRDMGTTSSFQRSLEHTRFGDNVRVRVFTGGRDHIVNQNDPNFRRMTQNLNAEVVHFDTATHDGTVALAAEWLANQR